MARIAGLTRGGSPWTLYRLLHGPGGRSARFRIRGASSRFQRKIFSGQIGMERAQMGAKTVPAALKTLAQARAGSLIGCPF